MPAKNNFFPKKIGVIGTYLPRRCGLATFTYDTVHAFKQYAKTKSEVIAVAMNDTREGYDYDSDVHIEVLESRDRDYLQAAEFLNTNLFDMVLVEHEFGIFGGPAGDKLLQLINKLRMPVVVNLHTVLEEPEPEYRYVFEAICRRADKLVVMTEKAREMLQGVYGVTDDKVSVIPHGTPSFSFTDPIFHKEKFGVLGKKVIMTFGLLSPNKGLEYMIEAMPKIHEKHPEAVYMIVGSLHPHIKKMHGTEYTDKLKSLAKDLGVEDSVHFVDGFFEIDELMEYIETADVYVTPYCNKEQITSGTLAYAMSAGKPIVSTPYWHAEEVLADGRGVLADFKSADSLAEKISDLLSDEVGRSTVRKKAYHYCRHMTWPEVAKSYYKLFADVLHKRVNEPQAPKYSPELERVDYEIPDVTLKYLKALSDDTGMLEHAKYAIPNSKHGYCTDDNARALIATLLSYQQDKDPEVLEQIYRYMSFLLHAFDPSKGWFRNRLYYNREWDNKDLSEAAHGRALWALGLGCAIGPEEIRHGCMKLFHDAIPTVKNWHHPHALAFTLMGLHYYLQSFEIDTICKTYRKELCKRLYEQFDNHESDDWKWMNDCVTWGAASIPGALILAGRAFKDQPYLQKGLDVLKWLIKVQKDASGYFSFIGNRGWYRRGEDKPSFDQQPIDAMCMVSACIDAYTVTREPYWQEHAKLAVDWFLGANTLHASLYDPLSGGCRDGLQPTSTNENQGAESTLAWLISALRYKQQFHPNKQGGEAHDVDDASTPEREEGLSTNR